MIEFIKSLFGSKQDKDLKSILPIIDKINEIADSFKAISDSELREKSKKLKKKIESHTSSLIDQISKEENKLNNIDLPQEEILSIKEELAQLNEDIDHAYEEILDEILPEAFAIVKETCSRLKGKTYEVAGTSSTWNMVPYDVQLVGGIVLHHGKIAEMATGEGKTLAAVLPTFLNALTGKGVHIVTVNDYLAQRDSDWMKPVFEFHGIKVDVLLNTMSSERRKIAYNADVTYGTNNEFGFDYLRDNMETEKEHVVHRNFYYTIVDEVDSVLIDEARTPLIISGVVPDTTSEKYTEIKPHVERLVRLQKSLVASLIANAENHLTKQEELDKSWKKQAGLLLLRAKRGHPKNKKLIKLLGASGNAKIMEDVETEYLRDNAKKMHEVDEELYFAIDERFHIIDVTEKGRDQLSLTQKEKDFFVIPDVGTEIAKIESNEDLSESEKISEKEKVYQIFSSRTDRIHNVSQLLKAYSLYEKDVEYVVQEGKVLIVDEFTGRILPGRRYGDGLHQAIEAKESVKIERETQTMATITLQNYFRLYKKIAGMTGTAETEEMEFHDIYKLDVVVIPTNVPVIREDFEDKVYKTKREKLNAVVKEIESRQEAGQPILVGTTSVDASETLSRMLKRKHIHHNVLNAKHHQKEAEIISSAGHSGNVTIATNMAGRGTDIKLSDQSIKANGLLVIGTERHESRRIDRQLRGRSGRQGDPGSSKFYLSLEDDLMRLFGSDRISRVMDSLNHEEGMALEHSLVTKSIERAQRKIEEQNFATRKRLLEYDNVLNQQREIIYEQRKNALFKKRLRAEIFDHLHSYTQSLAKEAIAEAKPIIISDRLALDLGIPYAVSIEELERLDEELLANKIYKVCTTLYNEKEVALGEEIMIQIEKIAILAIIDEKWRDHLRDIDTIKEAIHLRAYGQKDPLLEYKKEAFQAFSDMLIDVEKETIKTAFKLTPRIVEQQPALKKARPQKMQATHETFANTYAMATSKSENQSQPSPKQPIRVEKEPGRNEPCTCGSGKKYKHCHGR